MINNRFLNYKRYSSFIRDLNNNLISKDAIVFVQDETHTCIWTHGKEYTCNVGKSNLEEGTLVFGDGYGSNLFTILINNGKIILTDSDGDSYSVDYLLKSQVDTVLSSTSKNPVENRAIYEALSGKANKNEVLTRGDISGKQDKLTAGRGIDIKNNIISSTLDTEVYVILTQDEFPPENPSENKIYLVQVYNGDGTYRYIQYIYRNGQWFSTDQITPEIVITGYLKKADADLYYQPKGDYITIGDVSDYCDINIMPVFNNYYTRLWIDEHFQLKPSDDEFATKKWSKSMFVLRDEVYIPKQEDLGTDTEGQGGTITPSSGVSSIEVDSVLSNVSKNPVQNKVITSALSRKVDDTTLISYATKQFVSDQIDGLNLDSCVKTGTFENALLLKQDKLTAGNGISIVNNVISSTLDTNVFVIVDELPNIPDRNKIYILHSVDQSNNHTYIQYSWNGSSWVQIGQASVDVDLLPYLKSADAQLLYQQKGNYALADALNGYVTSLEFALYKSQITLTYLTLPLSGSFVTNVQLETAISTLQSLVDETYVRKEKVYEPKNLADWEANGQTPVVPDDNPGSGSGSSNEPSGAGNGGYFHLFIEQYQYDNLLSYDANTIYFIYEEQEESETWAFGDEFPIILS